MAVQFLMSVTSTAESKMDYHHVVKRLKKGKRNDAVHASPLICFTKNSYLAYLVTFETLPQV